MLILLNDDIFQSLNCNPLQLFPQQSYLAFLQMKFGRTDSQGDAFYFSKIKDLHFFRHLFRQYDISLIKEYIQTSLHVKSIDGATHHQLEEGFLYIPNQQAQIKVNLESESITVRIGHAFPYSITTFLSLNCFLLYTITKKTVLILETLYFIDLPFVSGMKCSEKLTFLQGCEVLNLNFNSFAYRRGQEVDSIYYLLDGQIKLFKELGQNIYEIASLEKGRVFGLFQMKSKLKHRELYAKAGTNNTQILKIPLKLIQRICLQREITLQCLLGNERSQIYSILKSNNIERKTFIQQIDRQNKSHCSSRILLQKRMKTFENSQKIKSEVIQNLVESKKIMFRVKELSDRLHNSSNKNRLFQTENIHAIRHFNDKWKYQKQKSKIEKTSKRRQISTAIPSSFKRLMKYPSVQRYLGMQSVQQPFI